MTKFLMSILKFNFGEFEEREFKKFLRMGMILMFIIGIYWTMRPLKSSLFNQLVGAEYQPYAKTVSLILMIPCVALYTKLLDVFSKSKLLSYLPPVFYGSIMLLYAGFIWAFQSNLIAPSTWTMVLGYFWYFFVESFGSLVVALFWSFATEITESKSAKQGFPLIYLFAQFGGIVAPLLIITLPVNLGIKSDALSIIILVLLTFLIGPLVSGLLKKTPKDLLVSVNKEKSDEKSKKEKTGFVEGLKLLFTHKYLLGMFAVNFFLEFIVTVFDFNFQISAAQVYSGVEYSRYIAVYGSCANLVTLIFLLLGISNITKRLGIAVALSTVPVLFGLAVFGFLSINSLNFLFCLMIASKAITYALSGPALKQLYIPTSRDAKSKAQAWIETFGSRFSKECGAGINMLYKPLGAAVYRFLTCGIGFVFVAIWFFIALYLGRTCKKAVESDTIVC